jgi:hypothetical protein
LIEGAIKAFDLLWCNQSNMLPCPATAAESSLNRENQSYAERSAEEQNHLDHAAMVSLLFEKVKSITHTT